MATRHSARTTAAKAATALAGVSSVLSSLAVAGTASATPVQPVQALRAQQAEPGRSLVSDDEHPRHRHRKHHRHHDGRERGDDHEGRGRGDDRGDDEGEDDRPPAPSATPAPTPSGPLTAGTFLGAVTDPGYGHIQVRVTVANNAVTDVKAVKYPTGLRTSARINARAVPQLESRALKARSANFASVSGATYTSSGFKTSMQSALVKAGN